MFPRWRIRRKLGASTRQYSPSSALREEEESDEYPEAEAAAIRSANISLGASIGVGAFFTAGGAAVSFFLAAGIVSSVVALVVLTICGALVVGAIAAGLTMAIFMLYDSSVDDKEERFFISLEARISALERHGAEDDAIELMDAPVSSPAPVVPVFIRVEKIEIKALNSFGKFSPFVPVVPLPDDGQVVLTDGTQVSKEKAEAVYEKLKIKVTDEKSQGEFSLIYRAIENYSKDGARILKAQSKALARFISQDEDDDNDYPIVRSDHTIDEETRRIILCATKKTSGRFEIVDPVIHAPECRI